MEPDEVIQLCWKNIPRAHTLSNLCNVRMAARLAWEQKEVGGLVHVQFAYRNKTPIVPIGHCCHPLELVKRGYIDGTGWPKEASTVIDRVQYFKWPDGNHWYASLDGRDITQGKQVKWNSQSEAQQAAIKWITAHQL